MLCMSSTANYVYMVREVRETWSACHLLRATMYIWYGRFRKRFGKCALHVICQQPLCIYGTGGSGNVVCMSPAESHYVHMVREVQETCSACHLPTATMYIWYGRFGKCALHVICQQPLCIYGTGGSGNVVCMSPAESHYVHMVWEVQETCSACHLPTATMYIWYGRFRKRGLHVTCRQPLCKYGTGGSGNVLCMSPADSHYVHMVREVQETCSACTVTMYIWYGRFRKRALHVICQQPLCTYGTGGSGNVLCMYSHYVYMVWEVQETCSACHLPTATMYIWYGRFGKRALHVTCQQPLCTYGTGGSGNVLCTSSANSHYVHMVREVRETCSARHLPTATMYIWYGRFGKRALHVICQQPLCTYGTGGSGNVVCMSPADSHYLHMVLEVRETWSACHLPRATMYIWYRRFGKRGLHVTCQQPLCIVWEVQETCSARHLPTATMYIWYGRFRKRALHVICRQPLCIVWEVQETYSACHLPTATMYIWYGRFGKHGLHVTC